MYEKVIDSLVELIRKDEQFIDYASYPLRGKEAKAVILLKEENIVISGIDIVRGVLSKLGIKHEFYYKDGQIAQKGIIGMIEGDAYNLLISERSILNTLSFMSAIATKVRKLVEVIEKSGKNVKIAATRKTIPFTSEMQKIAIMHGGGDTHRLNLSDCAMIKDNHLKLYGSVRKAVEEVKKVISFSKKIEVEVEDEESSFEACEVGADIVMLDNFPPQKACEVARKIKEKFPHVLIELSGGVNPEKLSEYLCEYVDVISIGKLTSEVKYVDFSMEIED
ncbi:MAG: carboxylating nicotinate-nucleotide diphosphorylase [Fervidobacterium sp.]|uniref:nicotinate-nucleotide diphosphorylase (carboxylating) n=1 Tax=Fervidobacterium gondwanense DSM 13020 TaxID=1121883 RepID=A0A1M7SSZ7_FERGO|nr:carboxylating nicotinate-nucleotide diphosphorylase [Fervidobacterium gondwanense]UXF00562.1 nicotinate-nucleotide pyrophosphorylase [Fervidobacterium riparium]SHN61528.1 nicotinate-nucleotide pyrophosphorylase [carboxylating] [Fervidobacterium gondwanense DSM 13020]